MHILPKTNFNGSVSQLFLSIKTNCKAHDFSIDLIVKSFINDVLSKSWIIQLYFKDFPTVLAAYNFNLFHSVPQQICCLLKI